MVWADTQSFWESGCAAGPLVASCGCRRSGVWICAGCLFVGRLALVDRKATTAEAGRTRNPGQFDAFSSCSGLRVVVAGS